MPIVLKTTVTTLNHFGAKRGLAIACRLSLCLSVCNVSGFLSHRLEYFRNNFTLS